MMNSNYRNLKYFSQVLKRLDDILVSGRTVNCQPLEALALQYCIGSTSLVSLGKPTVPAAQLHCEQLEGKGGAL